MDGNTFLVPGQTPDSLLFCLTQRLPPPSPPPSPPLASRTPTPRPATTPPRSVTAPTDSGANRAWLNPLERLRTGLDDVTRVEFDRLGMFVPCLRGYVGTKVVQMGAEEARLTVVGRVTAKAPSAEPSDRTLARHEQSTEVSYPPRLQPKSVCGF